MSTAHRPLNALLATKPLLIHDGAMGTELQQRGVDVSMPLWSARSLITHPCVVRQIHEEYVGAGADIITANTFRTNRRALNRAGIGQRTEELTRLAVALAREAQWKTRLWHRVLIAGSIAPVEDCYSPELVPSDTELRAEHGAQARILAEAGVDFLLIETMNSIREARIAVEAAFATGREFVVSFVCNGAGVLFSGETLSEAVREIKPLRPTMLAINCVRARRAHVALAKLRAATSLPVGVYANTGTPREKVGGEFEAEVDEQGYAACAAQWKSLGARLIGGCCGTTPGHIATLCSYEYERMDG
jgi:S-methylmethionine-dependent homocysteine/selenocysteine methylase